MTVSSSRKMVWSFRLSSSIVTAVKLARGPDMVSRGFVYMDESEDLMDEAKEIVIHAINHLSPGSKSETETVQEEIRVVLAAVFQKENGSTPDGTSRRYADLIAVC